DRLAEARKKQEQREQGIRAQAVKQGRELERAEILRALGVQRLEDASTSAQLRAERDARPTAAEEIKHAKAARREGIIMGVILGAILTMGVAAGLMKTGTAATVFGVAGGSRVERHSSNVQGLEALDRVQ